MEVILFIINLAVFILGIKITYDDWHTNQVVMWEFTAFTSIAFMLKISKLWLIPNIVGHILSNEVFSQWFMLGPAFRSIHTSFNTSYLKISTGLAFLIVLVWALKSRRMAPADVLLIFVIFFTTGPIWFVVLMLTASTVGIGISVLYNRRYIPFLSILIPLWMLT